MKIEFVPRGSGSTLTLDDKAISSVDAARTHTALGDFVVRVRGDRRLETRAQRQDRVHIKQGGTTQFTGFLTGVRHRSSGETELRGKGIGKLLQESRPDYANLSNGKKTYDNTFAGDAIADYWGLTQFGNVTTTRQTSTVVVTGAQQQSADSTSEWQNALESIPDTTPLYIDNGRLKMSQTAHIAEAEDHSVGNVVSDVDYSDGEAIEGNSVVGDRLFEYTFTTNHKMPAGDWQAVVRSDRGSTNGTPDAYELTIDGTRVGSTNGATTLSWQKNNATFDLPPGSHTLRMKITQGNDDRARADVMGIVDTRFTHTFDNTVDSDNGHLDGPELYAPGAAPTVRTPIETTPRNIVEATATVSFNTNFGLEVGLSDDGGSNFKREYRPVGDVTKSFSSAGRELVTEFSLFTTDPPTRSQTPRKHYEATKLDAFTTSVDLDDRIVFVDLNLTKNHFDNLQKLHENADYIFVIDHDDGDPANMAVLSFPRGEESRSASALNDNAIDESPEVNTDRFYNKIPVQGADNNGRPLAEVSDSNSISNIGDEISPGLLRDPTLNSEVECRFKARALLDKALKNQELRGQKVVPGSISLLPGASYSVGFLDDSPSEKVLEETRLRLSADGDAELTADFVAEETLRREIADLRRNQRQTADRL